MERLARQLRELIVASDHYRQTMAAGLRIGISESAVLGHLLHNGPQTPSIIAARVGLTPASTTALLDRLAGAQLVRRMPNPHDRRSVLVELTDLGRAGVEEMYTMFAIDIDAALDQADPRLRAEPELRAAVTDLLGRMAAALRERSGDRRGIEEALAVAHDHPEHAVDGSTDAGGTDAGSTDAGGTDADDADGAPTLGGPAR